jgi:hypothetical protein
MLDFLHKIFARPDTEAPSIGSIKLTDEHGVTWVFNPQIDITPLEIAKLMPLFSMLPLCLKTGLNWQGYVDNYGLWRHFEVKP